MLIVRRYMMQINQIAHNVNFNAKFSPELKHKVEALGMYLLRKNDQEGFEDLKNNLSVIHELFPTGTIILREKYRDEYIRDAKGEFVYKFPVKRFYLSLERPYEKENELNVEIFLNKSFRIIPENIRKIAESLETRWSNECERGTHKNDNEYIRKLKKELPL